MVYPPEGSLASALATLEGLECQTAGDWDVVLGEEQTCVIEFVPVWKPLFRVIFNDNLEVEKRFCCKLSRLRLTQLVG
jgi:hypothetical protein